jgi:metal-dependent amidase/aminoacylase/carboxypeptidase family protein
MAVSNPDQLKAEIDELVPDLIATRRDLHEHSELAFEEVRTSGIVAQRLRSLGLDVRTASQKQGSLVSCMEVRASLAQKLSLFVPIWMLCPFMN